MCHFSTSSILQVGLYQNRMGRSRWITCRMCRGKFKYQELARGSIGGHWGCSELMSFLLYLILKYGVILDRWILGKSPTIPHTSLSCHPNWFQSTAFIPAQFWQASAHTPLKGCPWGRADQAVAIFDGCANGCDVWYRYCWVVVSMYIQLLPFHCCIDV